MTIEEWEDIVKDVKVIFSKDNNFAELKEIELLNDRLDVLGKIDSYIGTYFSRQYVYRTVLGMTSQEAKEMEDQIEKERAFNPDEYKPAPTGSAGGLGDLGGDIGGAGAPIDFGAEGDMGEVPEPTAEPTGAPETTSPDGEVTFAPPGQR